MINYCRSSDYFKMMRISRSRQKQFKEDQLEVTDDDDDYQDDQVQLSQDDINSIKDLRKEVRSLKNQMKTLKKISIISIFGSRERMKHFYNDLW